jgi:hypothetical protein
MCQQKRSVPVLPHLSVKRGIGRTIILFHSIWMLLSKCSNSYTMLAEKHPSTRVTSITEKSLCFMDQPATHSWFRQKVITVEGFELNPGANGLNLSHTPSNWKSQFAEADDPVVRKHIIPAFCVPRQRAGHPGKTVRKSPGSNARDHAAAHRRPAGDVPTREANHPDKR